MAILTFLLPFLILLIATVVFRKPLWVAALIAYIFSLVINLLSNTITFTQAQLAFGNSIITAVEISLILFGAIFFLNILKAQGAMERISNGLKSLSSDRNFQLFLIAWLLGSFIEGGSGFGTPAIIIAPLLASLGYPLVLSVGLALVANTTGVVFGAVGTPINIGFTGLAIENVPQTAAFINLLTGWAVPVFLLFMVAAYQNNFIWNDLKKEIPLAILAGFSFTIPAYFLSFLGPEFPSLIGSLIGMIFFYGLARGLKSYLPGKLKEATFQTPDLNFLKNFSPYLILSVLLVGSRLIIRNKVIILDVGNFLNRNLAVFQPGIIFLFTCLILILIGRKGNFKTGELAKEALLIIPKPAAAILFIAAVAQNAAQAQISFLGEILPHGFEDKFLILATPVLGTIGSFAAGSATVSNLLMGQEVYNAGKSFVQNLNLILALQVIGAAIGNALALQNIAVVQAAVKLDGREREILKGVYKPILIYLALVILTGLLIHFTQA
jgi:lactate permease